MLVVTCDRNVVQFCVEPVTSGEGWGPTLHFCLSVYLPACLPCLSICRTYLCVHFGFLSGSPNCVSIYIYIYISSLYVCLPACPFVFLYLSIHPKKCEVDACWQSSLEGYCSNMMIYVYICVSKFSPVCLLIYLSMSLCVNVYLSVFQSYRPVLLIYSSRLLYAAKFFLIANMTFSKRAYVCDIICLLKQIVSPVGHLPIAYLSSDSTM
jgi:hypothetical protein